MYVAEVIQSDTQALTVAGRPMTLPESPLLVAGNTMVLIWVVAVAVVDLR